MLIVIEEKFLSHSLQREREREGERERERGSEKEREREIEKERERITSKIIKQTITEKLFLR